MPPGFKASVAHLPTFPLPATITSSASDHALGKALIDAWRRDGILQIAMDSTQRQLWADANAASRAFFGRPHAEKAACVDAQSYAGYIASGEEITDGIADYSEIFTITKDLGVEDPRVRAGWPGHGPCPWPDAGMSGVMKRFEGRMGEEGEKLLKLAELGLGVSEGALTGYTRDGWHHTRVLRYVGHGGMGEIEVCPRLTLGSLGFLRGMPPMVKGRRAGASGRIRITGCLSSLRKMRLAVS
jgi:isopenicillin N synthase-like dioxygenase